MSDSKPTPQKDLDELIAQFEDAVRSRPTPTELAESERAGTAPRGDGAAKAPEPGPEPARAPQPELALEPAQEPEPTPVSVSEAPAAEQVSEAELAPAEEPEVQAAAPPARVEALQAWWDNGERVEVELPGGAKYAIFTRVLGQGPWMTLIHGFPTSSWDWAPIAPELTKTHRLLTFDLLGFGDSDKPTGHDWSAFEQADIVEALWRHFGVQETRVVAHDVGMTVALELLARQDDGQLATRMSDYTLLNGGVYTGFHRPRPIQVWLQRPIVGALISQFMSERQFNTALAAVFGPGHQPTPEYLHQHWLSVTRRDGQKTYHRLIKYIPERRANAARWEAAVEQTKTPIRFVWGMADPISGAHMAEVIKERRPGADIVELADVGHYPQLEAPDRVAAAATRPAPTR